MEQPFSWAFDALSESPTGLEPCFDSQNFTISDLVDMVRLEHLFQQFSLATGYTTGLLDYPSMKVILQTSWRPICTVFHRGCSESAKLCLESDIRLIDGLCEMGETRIQTCANGLVDCATPIVIGGRKLAILATGQMLLENPDIERFRNQARKFGFDEQEYLKALGEIPLVSEEQLRAVTSFLGDMANFISQLGYNRLAELAEKNRAETLLRENMARVASLVKMSPVAMFMIEMSTGAILYSNKMAITTFGYTLEQVPAMDSLWPRAFPDPEMRRQVVELWEELKLKVMEDNCEIVRRELPVVCGDGSTKMVLVYGVPVHELNIIITVLEDITEFRAAQRHLQDSERRLKLSVDAAGMGIWDWDIATNSVCWDSRMRKLYGADETSDNMGPELWLKMIHPDDREEAIALLREVMDGTAEKYNTEFRLCLPQGGIRHVKADGIVLRDSQGKAIRMLGVNYDITERKQTQARLFQAEKMDAIGQLAGGVAHDFNNMLGGILGAADIVGEKIKRGEDPGQFLDLIINAAERASELTGKLLSFARKQPMAFRVIDIRYPLKDSLDLLERTADRRIRVHREILLQELPVQGDHAHLQNIFLNLLINAAHAMPEGGDIFVSAALTELSDEYCRASSFELSPGPYAHLSIRDTGVGIAAEHMDHIFEPFFTTKRHGKGTGLGLAAVLGTMQQHNGAVTVYSEPGAGTSFHLYFPLSQIEPSRMTDCIQEPISGSGKILLIDDERVIRATAEETLGNLGYQVLLAGNGREGLELFQRERDTIDLVILDLVMPEMSGRDCLAALRALKPDVRVVLSSGFSRQEELHSLLASGVSGFIRKPYRALELSRVIHQALERESSEKDHICQ